MQLSMYIKDLLYRHECVIIPGFGAFITHFESAKIDTKTHTFYPPGKFISFNQRLQTNDGLLANYIATVENCNYETALLKVRNFSAKLSRDLTQGKTIFLENIGEFILNKEQKIEFTPEEHQNFYAGSFGLTQFVSTQITRELYKSQAETIEKKAPLFFTPEKRRKTPYLKYAAIALIAVSISGLTGLKIYEGNIKNHNITQRQKAENQLENKIQEATFVINNPLPAVTVKLVKQKGRYHIIAGAFRIAANADKKITQLLKQGYQASLIGVNKYGLHQVAYQSFEDRKKALVALQKIKATKNPNAWLLVQDLD